MGSSEDITYIIGNALHQTAEHHESFEKLWTKKWKPLCEMRVYPFMFGTPQDFEPVAQAIIAKGLKPPYDWDEYASMFFPKAEELFKRAEEAEGKEEREKAAELFLRSSALYRISRFPIPRSPKQRLAWQKNKEAFYRGAALLPTPILPLQIPHTHRSPSNPTTELSVIQANLCLPSSSAATPPPLVILLTGLDGYRTELGIWQPGFSAQGIATLVLEIPGTGDSPCTAQSAPDAVDRFWDSVADWIGEQHSRGTIDKSRVVLWGFSTGGFYALRAAHTHPALFKAVVSLGGGCDRMFAADWLANADKREYPFDLCGALAAKFGYDPSGTDPAGRQRFVDEAYSKYSLVVDGTLDKPCCERVLLVNGELDEIFPIEDLWMALQHGRAKEARVVKGRKHMGEPESFRVVLRWIWGVLELEGDPMVLLGGLAREVKY